MNRLESLAAHEPLFAETRGDIHVSFEFFPPKTEKMEETLWESVKTLEPLAPRFVSVTYGAGGSTRERTHATVARIVRETSIPAAAHLTCVNATREEVDAIARSYWEVGVRHIVAIRGDPPEQGAKFVPHPGGYANAAELVAGLKKTPGKVSFASSGTGSSDHLSAELFWQQTDTSGVHIPYKGGGPAINDLLGAQVYAAFVNINSIISHIKAGKVRALGVASEKRNTLLPDLPTLAEQG
jgi:hypothetical protein